MTLMWMKCTRLYQAASSLIPPINHIYVVRSTEPRIVVQVKAFRITDIFYFETVLMMAFAMIVFDSP